MNIADAERAFREMLPCETVRPDISTGKILKFEKPIGLLIERHESLLTKHHLIFPIGEKSIIRFEIDRVKLSEG